MLDPANRVMGIGFYGVFDGIHDAGIATEQLAGEQVHAQKVRVHPGGM